MAPGRMVSNVEEIAEAGESSPPKSRKSRPRDRPCSSRVSRCGLNARCLRRVEGDEEVSRN